MAITSDWHIHSRNSCDGACMTVADLIRGTAAMGITDFGLTDHFHTPYNAPDIAASRREYLACRPSSHFHFGIEVSCVSAWELREITSGTYENPVYGIRSGGPPGAEPAIALTPNDVCQYGIEYVVAGVHWPLYEPFEREAIIRSYHRQNMYLVTHPLVDIVAHPWWWMGHWQSPDGRYLAEPWFDDFRVIPQSMHEEFAAAAVARGTVIEINLPACLCNPHYPESFTDQYLEYLSFLKSRRVRFSFGSDRHEQYYHPDLERAARLLEQIGLHDEDLWRLPPRSRTDETRGALTDD